MADVDIIGGSAAGLFAGYLLAREGKTVHLFDANDVLNAGSRTLITTARLSDALGFYPREAVVNRIDRIDLHSPRHSVSIPMHEPDLVIERSAIIRLLAEKAVHAGVDLRAGCKLVDVKPGDKDLTVTIRDTHRNRTEHFKTKTLIGADGMASRVARSTAWDGVKSTPLLQAIVELPKGSPPGTTQVWFEPAATPYFYWLIPQSSTHAAVGLIAEDGHSSRQRLEQFLDRIGRLRVVDIQSARIPIYNHSMRPWHHLAGCNVYLIGDAATQVKVTTVGGLVTGLRGARAVVSAILCGSNYLKELRPLRRELGIHLVIRKLLNYFNGTDYDRLLTLLNEKTIRLLGLYNRDQAAKILYRILLAQPRLIAFAALLPWRLNEPEFDGNRSFKDGSLYREADM